MTTQKPLDLAPIRARDKARTQGEWRYDGMHFEITVASRPSEEGGYWLIISECGAAPDQERKCPCDQFGHQFDANYDFIAHASVDIPALIAEVEWLRGMLEQVADEHHGLDARPLCVCKVCKEVRALLGKE